MSFAENYVSDFKKPEPLGFGQLTAEQQALEEPDIQPSDAWNIPKIVGSLGMMAPAAIIKLFHAGDKPSIRAMTSHGTDGSVRFDPAQVGKNADYDTPAQGWYGGPALYHGVQENTEASKLAERSYANMAQDRMHERYPFLRPTGGGTALTSEGLKTNQYVGDTLGFRNARVLETSVDENQLLDVSQGALRDQYNQRLSGIMTGNPADGRDFILRRQQWAQGVLRDALDKGKLGVKFGQNEVVIPDPSSLKYRERKVR